MREIRVVGCVLYGASADIVEMVRRRIPSAIGGFTKDAVGLGVVRRGRLLGGVVFDMYTGTDIVMSGAFDDPSWATKKTLRQLFLYPFVTCGCRRMTTITRADNAAARSLDERLGFRLEGVMREAYDDGGDAVLYGMLRRECRWLGEQDSGW